ncbi:glutamine synthetase family protein [Pseudaestuariivita atlantica]|uniref:Glutamine synthetase n=1 Tax=Pseudaestuariivita atlantica TaxID=1317121 RepID=A0A0L1JUG6_9RHOB|nr:glutamine synthetase family protein [Pseudaestuariivita atlantica]KNG95337.1 glutamine synthetase [Pseudaestuariivita atlantica]
MSTDTSPPPPVRIAATDLNGQWRGKRVSDPAKARAGVRMPVSALSVDILGADIAASPLVFATGDADGLLRPTGRGPVPLPWLAAPQVMEPAWMFTEDGAPFAACPRQALQSVLDRYAARGWLVRAGIEMEFTLVDDTGPVLAPPRDPWSGRPLRGEAILSMRQLDAFDGFVSALADGAAAMGIRVETVTSEAGIGQFEVTLAARDAMRAADDAALFKLLARGTARAHGLAATFMAKPYPDDAGNGMHVHASVVDADGANVFDDGGAEGSALLRHAIAGCLDMMGPATLIFAPHGNSYDRMVPGAHAPTSAQWGYENRTVALRVPGGPPAARRLEHRVPGGDTAPHLVVAAILGGMHSGIEDAATPPDPVTGNAYDIAAPGLEPDWTSAIDRFETAPQIARTFDPLLIETLVRTKRQDFDRVTGIPPEDRWQVWLETV